MASSFSTSSTSIDRKSLKQADSFLTVLREFFGGLIGHAKGVLVLVGAIFALGVLAALYMNHRDAQAKAGRNAYFLAQKTLETELKALVPAPPAKAPAAPKSKTDAPEAKEPPAPTVESLTYQKMDVDTKLAGAVKKLTEVSQVFASTRSGYDAAMNLGDLYFNHGEFAKASPWYEKGLAAAPDSFEKAIALSSLGYVQENLSKPAEALQYFQKAIKLGEAGLKGDLLLAVARCYEATNDTVKARATYDQILTDLPNTEYAKSAEIFKAQLK